MYVCLYIHTYIHIYIYTYIYLHTCKIQGCMTLDFSRLDFKDSRCVTCAVRGRADPISRKRALCRQFVHAPVLSACHTHSGGPAIYVYKYVYIYIYRGRCCVVSYPGCLCPIPSCNRVDWYGDVPQCCPTHPGLELPLKIRRHPIANTELQIGISIPRLMAISWHWSSREVAHWCDCYLVLWPDGEAGLSLILWTASELGCRSLAMLSWVVILLSILLYLRHSFFLQ